MRLTRRATLAAGASLLAACRTTSSNTTRSDAHALRDAMEPFVVSGFTPGLVAAVKRRGALEVEALGKTAIDGGPMRRDSVFRIASVTKPMAAVVALSFVEDGTFSLDDKVEKWLPELANRRVLKRLDGPLDDTVPAKRAITVRDLLTFTSGYGVQMVPPGTTPFSKAMEDGHVAPMSKTPPAPDEWLRRISTLPLLFQPGEGWAYHTSESILGVLLARVAGKPLDVVMSRRLFEPLGMSDTAFDAEPPRQARFTTAYAPDPKTGALTVFDAPDGAWAQSPAFPDAAGGLVSTVDDCLRFGEMLLGGGERNGVRVLKAESVRAMASDQLTAKQKQNTVWLPGGLRGHSWGLGTAVCVGDALGRSDGTFGWDGGLGSSFWVDPSTQLIGVMLTLRAMTSPEPTETMRAFWKVATAA